MAYRNWTRISATNADRFAVALLLGAVLCFRARAQDTAPAADAVLSPDAVPSDPVLSPDQTTADPVLSADRARVPDRDRVYAIRIAR